MKKLSGVMTALATPFVANRIDLDSFKRLVNYQLDSGIHGLVVNGTTGESPTLSLEEVELLFLETKKIVGDKIPVILGTGSNDTQKTCVTTRWAEELGADAALVVTPYYNKPTQEGLFLHFKTVAESTKLPVVLYNVPGRTITRIDVNTQEKLSRIENIIGVKDATGDMDFAQELLDLVDKNWLVTSGDDDTFLKLCLLGGQGVTSVISNIFPLEMVQLYERAKKGDESVLQEFKKYSEFLKFLYCESNPIPVKMGLHLKEIFSTAEMRLPLTRMTVSNTQKLRNSMQELDAL